MFIASDTPQCVSELRDDVTSESLSKLRSIEPTPNHTVLFSGDVTDDRQTLDDVDSTFGERIVANYLATIPTFDGEHELLHHVSTGCPAARENNIRCENQ